MERQRDAALEPRPLWELTDLMGRPQTRALALEDGSRGQQEDIVVPELTRRLQEVPVETCEGLSRILEAARPVSGLGDALGPTLGRAVARARDIDQAEQVALAVMTRIQA